MAKKRKYRSLDDLNAAQRKMNIKCVAIEDDLLDIVSNPLSALTGATGGNRSSGSRKNNKSKKNRSMGLADMLPGATGMVPGLVKQLLLKAIPSKKRTGSIFKTAATIALKVVIVDAAVWGFSKIKQRIQSNRKKIST